MLFFQTIRTNDHTGEFSQARHSVKSFWLQLKTTKHDSEPRAAMKSVVVRHVAMLPSSPSPCWQLSCSLSMWCCCSFRMCTRHWGRLSISQNWSTCDRRWLPSRTAWKSLPSNTGATQAPLPASAPPLQLVLPLCISSDSYCSC